MRLLRRLRAAFRRPPDDDIAEEVSYHVERLEAEERAHGMNVRAARKAARERFGDPALVRAQTRDVFALAAVDGLWRDLRFAWRGLVHEPLTLLAVTLCLGLGIGVTTTFHGLFDALLLHDVTAREPDRLVRFGSLSYPVWQEVRESRVFSELAAGGQCGNLVRWQDGGQQRTVVANCLSANFWDTVGAAAERGRLWMESEATLETNPRLVVLSHRFWRRTGSDPDVIGRTMVLNGAPYTVLGVLPEAHKAIQGYGIAPDIHLSINQDLLPRVFERDAPARDRLHSIGRLREGWSLEQTRDALSAVLAFAEPQNPQGPTAIPELRLASGLAKYRTEGFDRLVLTLSGLVSAIGVLFLVIACANAAGMLLARTSKRSQELQMCRALGATSIQLVRRQLAESLVVGGFGSAAGIGFAVLASRLCSAIVIPVQDVTLSLAFVPDSRTVMVGIGVGVTSAIIAGLAPAREAWRTSLSHLHARTMSGQPHFRQWLLGGQVCLSAVLLFVTYQAWQNTRIATGQSPGFDVAHTAWLDVAFDQRRSIAERDATRDRVLEALRGHPAVAAVSWAWYLPFQVIYAQPAVRSVPDQSVAVRVIEQGIGPNYFETMQIPLTDGREFSWNDLSSPDEDQPMVVINHTLARALFGDQPAAGRRIWRDTPGQEPMALTVIGVTADTVFRVPGESPPPMLHSLARRTASLVVRTRASPATAIPELSQVIDAAAPGAAAGGFPFAERVEKATFPARALAVVLGGFALGGVILTTAALAGLASYNVARRRREIGIRLALGATPARVITLMLTDHLPAITAGGAIGCALGVWLCDRLSPLAAADVSPGDPRGLLLVTTVLSAGAVAIVFLLARRAARESPSVALSHE